MSEFGEGEGELLTLTYPKPLPMRLDRWLVAQRPEQSRARIQKFIEAGYVRVNGVTGPGQDAAALRGRGGAVDAAARAPSLPAAPGDAPGCAV
jgi:Predicted rRNA methylase